MSVPRHRTHSALRGVDPLAVLFGIVCGLILAGGILGLMFGHPVAGIG